MTPFVAHYDQVAMRITVLLFAQLAESIGARSIEIEARDDATAADLLRAVEDKFPSLAAMRNTIAVAVDGRYTTRETVIGSGQTIALIPPVSGG